MMRTEFSIDCTFDNYPQGIGKLGRNKRTLLTLMVLIFAENARFCYVVNQHIIIHR
jgi:hypothetical protein